MTLIVAIPSEDGIVLGSDMQVTAGELRSTTKKIFKLNSNCLWAASGEIGLIQRVGEQIDLLSSRTREDPLTTIRDELANIIKQVVATCVKMDFRADYLGNNHEALLNLHPADFLFVEYSSAGPKILHILSEGITEWIETGSAVTGNGDKFAAALLYKYEIQKYPVEAAKLLVYKVIDESINVGSWGLGRPIDIWQVTSKGAAQCNKQEIDALVDAAETLRRFEIQKLLEAASISEDRSELAKLIKDEKAVSISDK